MPVTAIGTYTAQPLDRQANFHGAQLVYLCWENHLLFCAPFCFPFPPTMRFGDVVAGPMQAAFGYHPDFAQIDWAKAEWFKSGKPVTLDFDKSLAENGLALLNHGLELDGKKLRSARVAWSTCC